MSREDIREYAEIMKDWGLQRLTVTEHGTTVCLEKGITGTGALPVQMQPEVSKEDAIQEQEGRQEYLSVRSPMVGVFYAAPAENADPYVSAGSVVKEGDTICIIEAMKLMNEVRAECGGTIEKICVTNGQVVEYGTELFRIRRPA